MTIIIRQVIGKLDAVSSVLCHDPHFKGRRTCREAVPVHRQPMSLGKVEEHCRIATCGNDPPGRRIRLEPVLFKILLPRHTLHSILSIQDVVCCTVGIEDRRRGSQLLEAISGFLATRAIAGGGQNRPADCLQFHLAASAYPREVFLLFLVHCSRPFVGPVYEVILVLVRNVRNGGGFNRSRQFSRAPPASAPTRPGKSWFQEDLQTADSIPRRMALSQTSYPAVFRWMPSSV
jgi:hypothetical protein